MMENENAPGGSIPDLAEALRRAVVPRNNLMPGNSFRFGRGEAEQAAVDAGRIQRTYSQAREALDEAYESARKVRQEAMIAAREQVEKAEEQSSELLRQAREHSANMRNQVEAEAMVIIEQANQEAESLVAKAQAEYDKLIRDGQDSAARLMDETRRQAEETHNAAAAAMQLAIEYRNELQKIESQFETVAREFVKWLGLPVDSAESYFKRAAGR